MQAKLLRYVARLIAAAVVILLAVAVISLIYDLLKPESFFITLSNLSFFAGGIVLTCGAFVEFFWKVKSPVLGKYLIALLEYPLNPAAFSELKKDGENKETKNEASGGWMLIYLGALVIALSFISVFIGMK